MSAKADIPIEVLHQPHETPACSRKFTQRGRQLRARHRASSNSFHDYHASGAAPARKSGIMACLTVRHRHRRNKLLISRRNPGRISGFHPPEPTQVASVNGRNGAGGAVRPPESNGGFGRKRTARVVGFSRFLEQSASLTARGGNPRA